MSKQKILSFLLATIFVLAGSYILNVDTAYADTFTVTVTVVDNNDNALRNADVWYNGLGKSNAIQTNRRGEVTFELSGGTYTFKAEKTGYSMTETNGVSITVDANHTNVTIEMQ